MKSLKKIALITGATLMLLFIYFSVYSESKTTSSGYSNPNEPVENNYRNYCAGCHGDQLEKFADQNWMFANTPEEIAGIIREGEEEMGMPAFKETFSEKEIEELTEFILDAGKNKAKLDDGFVSISTNNSSGTAYWAKTVVTGLEIPWGMEFLPNGDLLIAERKGQLSRFTADKELIKISGLPEISVKGQGGLLDLQLHPDYQENGWIYISYSYPDEENSKKSNTAIIRARLDGDKLVDLETLYRGTPTVSTRYHFGSRIEFDRDGYLYFSIGDRGKRDKFPQSLDNSNGKVLRLFDDGRVPEDNPFVGQKDAEAAIYSYGHRNIQGMAMHPLTGDIWTHEHGPKGGDEVNIIEKGQNYGWPVISYGINYSGTKFTDITEKEGMLQPVTYYVPSIAPCGMAFVTSDKYPGWENNLLIGSLRFKYLERCVVENDEIVEQERLLEGIGRVRNVKVGPDGYIYVAVEEPGKILKLIPAPKD
jgi:glucose/arabinose dehydrogenase